MTSASGNDRGGPTHQPRHTSSIMWYLISLALLNAAALVSCRLAVGAFPGAVDGYVCAGFFCAFNMFGLAVFGYVNCLVWLGRIIDALRRATAARLGLRAA